MARITDRAASLSVRVVEEVAAARGVSIEDLSPLYYTIDPDALDTLFSPTKETESSGHIRFKYEGCTVVVTSDGTIEAATDDDPTAQLVTCD